MLFMKTLCCFLTLWQVHYLPVFIVGSDINAVKVVYDLESCPPSAYHDLYCQLWFNVCLSCQNIILRRAGTLVNTVNICEENKLKERLNDKD